MTGTFEPRVVALCQVAISQEDHCEKSCNYEEKPSIEIAEKTATLNIHSSMNPQTELRKKILEESPGKSRKTLRDIPWSITGRNILRAVPEEPQQKSRENRTEVSQEETNTIQEKFSELFHKHKEIPKTTPEKLPRQHLRIVLWNNWDKS